MDDLNRRQERFVNFYLGVANGNASKAYRMAYGDEGVSIGSRACQLLNKPNVQAEIKRRMRMESLDPDQTFLRLSEHAKADMWDFVSVDDEGNPKIDIRKGYRRGKSRLIKKLKVDADGSCSIELHDAQGALKTIAQIHGMLKDPRPVEPLAESEATANDAPDLDDRSLERPGEDPQGHNLSDEDRPYE